MSPITSLNSPPTIPMNYATNTGFNKSRNLLEPPKEELLPPVPLFPLKGFSRQEKKFDFKSFDTKAFEGKTFDFSSFEPLDPKYELSDVDEIEYCEQKYTSQGTFTEKQSGKSLIASLMQYRFPEDIVVKANNIFISIGRPTKRKMKRKFLIYGCVYFAYRENNIDFTPEDLANTIGIDLKFEHKSLSMIRKRGYIEKTQDKTPRSFLDYFLNSSAIATLDRTEIYKLLSLVLSHPEKKYMPQEIALGVINYFLMIKTITLNGTDPIMNYHVNSKKTAEIVDLLAKLDA